MIRYSSIFATADRVSGRHGRQVPAIGVVGGTSAFSGHHRRTERRLGGAFSPEGGAVVRLLDPAEYLAADAHARLQGFNGADGKAPLGVVVRERSAEPVAALRDGADAAPLAVADLEHLANQLPGRRVA